jgi:two-component system chemotaxis sensor kinase CheA
MLYATPLTLDAIAGEIDLPAERIRLVEDNRTVNASVVSPAVNVAPNPISAPAAEAVVIAAPIVPPPPSPIRPSAASVEADHKNIPAPSGNVAPAETTIRLNITLLDTLMTLAGELVLGRNQLNESVSRHDEPGIRSSAQRVSLVTSELQEVVALTRMQPVGSLFAKFQRLVRDLSRTLAKDVQLVLEGTEVEIDKSILEGLSDPLTHMVRNSVDHGIEMPAERIAAGKTPGGTITLKASHQAGQVVIEITDDGKGLVVDKIAASSLAKGQITSEQLQAMSERDKMALIFLPGVSTAEKLSDVSGRGVGMDVVKTNLDRLGGKIEIDSVPGRGSRFRIKLPLTLAIIPSLLVSNDGERFAIPQVSVGELIRVPVKQIAERIDRVGDAEVLILRDRLVPLVYLADVIGVPRSTEAARAMNVVTVDTGAFEYGLVVQGLHETVEIVVKPLGRHVKGLHDYAGATVLGDGCVAVILDVAGLAERAGLSAASAEALSRKSVEETVASGEQHSLLLFHNAPDEACAVPIEQVSRIEHIKASEINQLGGRRTMIYRGASLPLVTLHDVAKVGELCEEQQWLVIIFESLGRPFGLLAAEPLDMIESTLEIDSLTLRQPGVAGSAVHNGHPLLLVDIFELAEGEPPEGSKPRAPSAAFAETPGGVPTVLVADDSDFFRGQIQRLVESAGCRVLPAADGQEAWEILNQHASEIVLVATDVEMPRMDGLALTRQIRADHRFAKLPIIALSSLAGEEEIAHGLAAGVSEYQVKLNKDEFLACVHKAIGRDAGVLAA